MKIDFDIIGWFADRVAALRESHNITLIEKVAGNNTKYRITFAEVHDFLTKDVVTITGAGAFNVLGAVVLERTATAIVLKYPSLPAVPGTFAGTVTADTPSFRHFETWEVDQVLAELSNMSKGFPVIATLEPITWSDLIKPSAQIDSTFNVQMLFALPANFTSNTGLNSSFWSNAINPMRELAYMFISEVRKQYNVENVSVIPRFESLKNFPAASNKVSGVLLRLSFKLQNISNLC